jgi:hypothetical protein
VNYRLPDDLRKAADAVLVAAPGLDPGIVRNLLTAVGLAERAYLDRWYHAKAHNTWTDLIRHLQTVVDTAAGPRYEPEDILRHLVRLARDHGIAQLQTERLQTQHAADLAEHQTDAGAWAGKWKETLFGGQVKE